MIFVLGIVWGATFFVTEVALTGMTPFWLAASRQVIGAVALVSVWAVLGFPVGESARARRPWVLVAGVTSSALPFALLAWGQQFVTAGFAGVSMAAVALMVLPLAHILVPGERMTLRRTFGFVVGFVGVVTLMGAAAFDATGAAMEGAGRLACLGAAACYAVSSVLLRTCPPIHPVALAVGIILVGSSVATGFALAVEGAPVMPEGIALYAIIGLGLIPTALASLLRVWVVLSAGPVFMSLVNYQVPLWSVGFGALLLAEPVPGRLWLALALILTGVAFSQWEALRRLFTPQR
ncbi:MAG: DMT family transporter [Shimia sp.]